MNAHVQAEPPRSGVPVRREEVAPVLRDEPEPGEERGGGGGVLAHAVEEAADCKAEQEA
jgi:hypothetical protein